jgi:hypothetical protein
MPHRMTVLRRAALLLSVALLALPIAACGDKEKVTTNSTTEGSYLDVGGLQYQVQISRELNPFDTEDKAYLIGLPADQQELAPDESWFAVFIRVQNADGPAARSASDFSIVDTQDNVYHPIPLAGDNLFAYRPEVLEKNAQIPNLDTVPYNTPSIGGSLLLFRINDDAFENRPLVLRIQDPKNPQEAATVDLDV